MSNEQAELFEAFVTESRDALADVEGDLLTIEQNGADIDSDLVNKVFRGVHSMKGAAGYLGLTSIGSLAHEMENVLNMVRNHELVPTSEIVEALLRSADALSAMLDDLDHSNETDVSEYVAMLKKVVAGDVDDAVAERLNEEIDIDLPDGTLAFMSVCAHDLISRQQQGQNIHIVDLDLIEDVQSQGLTPIEFFKRVNEHAELIESYAITAGMGTLDNEVPDSLEFRMLIGTKLGTQEFSDAMGLPGIRVYAIATPDQAPWEMPAGPAGARQGSGASASSSAGAVDQANRGEGATPSSAGARPTDAPGASSSSVASASAAGPAAAAASGQSTTSGQSAGSGKPVAAMPKPKAAQTNLRVSVKVLDGLMTLAGELVLARNQLLQVVGSNDERGVESVAARVDQVTSELQERIMQTRMQAVDTVFSKFPRVVRDLGNSLNKQCALVIEGRDVELDKTIIEGIGDPLTHLVRNSLDHGLETPDVRRAAGKPETGVITLRAFHQGGKVNITIGDDGAGIDPQKLRSKAVEKGVLTAEQAESLSDRDAVMLIFHPGFSTAEKVSDVSGRGVGMDVVRTNIKKLGGSVDIDTKVGVGTTIHIRLPLTLAIIPSLVVRCGDARFAIPQSNIKELIRVRPSEVAERIRCVQDAQVLKLRGSLLSLVRLSDVLGIAPKFGESAGDDEGPATRLADDQRARLVDRRTGGADAGCDAEGRSGADEQEVCDRRRGADRRKDTAAGAINVIVVETGSLRYGLVVDALDDSQEIVVKPLGMHLRQCKCMAGATVLGDGQVALILDVGGIAQRMSLRQAQSEESGNQGESGGAQAEFQSMLLFRNHPDEQFAVPTGLISRIERISVDQIDSVGGQEILQYRGSSLRILTLDKLVTARPRDERKCVNVVVFNVGRREFGLLAPELTDIRKVGTKMDSDTLREPGIVGSLIIDDRTTRLIDMHELARVAHPPGAIDEDEVAAVPKEQPVVLFAEDSEFFRKQVANFLRSSGYEVVACEDGQIAWETLQDPQRHFSLLVTDIEMPNMDGLALTRRIRADERFSDLPIIAVTTLAGEDDLKRGREAGVNDYQVKMDREKLLAAIERLAGAQHRNPSAAPVVA